MLCVRVFYSNGKKSACDQQKGPSTHDQIAWAWRSFQMLEV